MFDSLQAAGSDWSGSGVGSSWTVHSDGQDSRVIERYRSFEDIAASHSMRSRRASSDDGTAFSSGLSVLRDSYIGIAAGSGIPSPHIKKLKWNFSFSTIDNYAVDSDCTDEEDIHTATNTPYYRDISTDNTISNESIDHSWKESRSHSRLSPLIKKLRRNITPKHSLQDLKSFGSQKFTSHYDNKKSFHNYNKANEGGSLPTLISHGRKNVCTKNSFENIVSRILEGAENAKRPFLRSVSTESSMAQEHDSKGRVRKLGLVRNMSYQGMRKIETDLRKEVLKQNLCNHHSCEDIFAGDSKKTYRGTTESSEELASGFRRLNIGNIQNSVCRHESIPTIVVTDVERSGESSVAKYGSVNPTITSKIVEISSNCDCRICMEEERYEREKKPTARQILCKILVKVASCRDYDRKLMYRDENNNWNEGEMYTSLMHVFKLMLGLWLRHLDHN